MVSNAKFLKHDFIYTEKLFPIENLASSFLSAFGLAQNAQSQQPPPSASAQAAPAASSNNSSMNTSTTNTTTTANSSNQQQGQLPRSSRISQLFVPISMNRSRRVILRRSSG